MTPWNKLLIALDQTIGFPNKKSSKVKKLKQGYDNNTGEHVFWLEYRIKVEPVLEEFDPVEEENKQRRRTYLQELVESIAASEAARLNEG